MVVSLIDPNRQGKPGVMCITSPCPGDIVPDFPDKRSDFGIETVPFPSISPWAFLAGAIGNIVGSFVGDRRGDGRGVEQPIAQQMPDIVEMMQREETNRLIRELLKTSKDKKDKYTMEIDLRKPDILRSGGDSFLSNLS